MYEGIGGKSALISIDDTTVFVKKVPLIDFEQLAYFERLMKSSG